jgi:hypothetical protein
LHGTAQQAEDRSRSHIRDIASYLEVRRRTIGARPSFNILEMDMDLPDEVKYNPTILELELLAIDLTIIANVSSWSFVSYAWKNIGLTSDHYRIFSRTIKSKLPVMTSIISSPSP